MVRLFGREYTRKEVQGYTGTMAQLGGIRPFELRAGRERGVRGFELTTGTGLALTVLADRALDITRASFRGRSLVYLSPSGEAHPSFYEPQGLGWLRTFPGGLLTTCGLSTLGSPGTDAGEELGLHGRVANLPMEEVGYWGEWVGEDYLLHITGALTEGVIFGNPLRFTRHITCKLGGSSVLIDDTVENLGGQPTPHMMLYHCNFGFPLLSPASELITASRRVTPRDEEAAAGLTAYNVFQSPTPGYAEQVFYHEMAADNAGNVRVALINPELDGGLGISLSYHQKQLPRFIQWKMMGYGSYVLGLEPANCYVEGRAQERERGSLLLLQPGEKLQLSPGDRRTQRPRRARNLHPGHPLKRRAITILNLVLHACPNRELRLIFGLPIADCGQG